jgi:hypothetical protein
VLFVLFMFCPSQGKAGRLADPKPIHLTCRAKLSDFQRVEGHHFSAQLLHWPTLPSAKDAAAAVALAVHRAAAKPQWGLSAAGKRAAAEAVATAATAAARQAPAFVRQAVKVKGRAVSTLVPLLRATNEVWQLVPEPPPGRYLLQLTPNPKLNKDLHSPSCFHAVVAA